MSIDEMRKIIADAPRLAEYITSFDYVWESDEGEQLGMGLPVPSEDINKPMKYRSLADIKTIIELTDKLAELEEEVEDVTRNKMISEHAYGRHVLKIEARNKVLETNQTKSEIEMKSKGITEAIKWIGVCWADNIGDSVICVDDLIGYARILDVEASRL